MRKQNFCAAGIYSHSVSFIRDQSLLLTDWNSAGRAEPTTPAKKQRRVANKGE